jgi:sialic acid synthase SpsE
MRSLQIRVGQRVIGDMTPTYFIADIGANHDGDLERALNLIRLAARSGADAAKFQHFRAETIVSSVGFAQLGTKLSHQRLWEKDVFDVYRDAALPYEWTERLAQECAYEGIDFLSTPYDAEAIEVIFPFVDAFKIGSGDITWWDHLEAVARRGKPVILGCGASTMREVVDAVEIISRHNVNLALLQCNTNYEGADENLRFLNLRVVQTFSSAFPDVIVGLSDHTQELEPVLGAVALGARIVERHFTDDTGRKGPDHSFAMSPDAWSRMVEAVRTLELGLGDGLKKVEANEQESVRIQRRSLRFHRKLPRGHVLSREDLVALRPAPSDSLPPSAIDSMIGRRLKFSVSPGDLATWEDTEAPD